MENPNKKRSLSLSEYERLCREACEGFVPSASRDADEEVLLYRICRKVFHQLDQELVLSPIADVTSLFAYKWNLQKLVSTRRSQEFDTLETPGKYIDEALRKAPYVS
jgi:hypothetical protein